MAGHHGQAQLLHVRGRVCRKARAGSIASVGVGSYRQYVGPGADPDWNATARPKRQAARGSIAVGMTPTEARTGRTIGRYTLFDEIGAGGMATVHLGRLAGPVGFSRTVAIKRLHPHCAHDPQFVSHFVDEARLAGRIQHPNVASMLDVVATEEELLLVMEYIHGEPLSRVAPWARADAGPVPRRVAVAIVDGILHGLHAAHEARSEMGEPLAIIHRDVTPQNILVGADGVVRLVDFGVAKAASRLEQTADGQIKGKLAYMPPEQIESRPIDRRVDVYAASVVLWEILVGRRLFAAEGPGAVINRVLAMPVVAPSKAAPDVPEVLDAVVMRGLSRDPAERFATADEMALALEDVLAPATAREVGAWLRSIAAKTLEARAGLVAAIESASVTPSGRGLTRGSLPPPHETQRDESDVSIAVEVDDADEAPTPSPAKPPPVPPPAMVPPAMVAPAMVAPPMVAPAMVAPPMVAPPMVAPPMVAPPMVPPTTAPPAKVPPAMVRLDPAAEVESGLVVANVSPAPPPPVAAVEPAPSPPHLSNVQPRHGSVAGRETLMLVGLDFDAGCTVEIGGLAAACERRSDSELRAVLPARASAGTVDVVVTNSDGQSSTLADAFTYSAPPAPSIIGVEPTSGPATGGTRVVVTGEHLQSVREATIGGKPALELEVRASEVAMTTPARVEAGFVDVELRMHDGTRLLRKNGFLYAAVPQPNIRSVSPNRGTVAGGTEITILGEHFAPGSSVLVDGKPARSARVCDAATIVFLTPPGEAGRMVDVTVRSPTGQQAVAKRALLYDTRYR
jgi:serine/threonine protein kinase